MYGYDKIVQLDFDSVVAKTREELQKEGFGVLTEIDVQSTLKKKLDVNFDKYLVLGSCNPPFAYKALLAEKAVGLLLPCNVIIYEENGAVTVSAILPTIAMQMVNNDKLKIIAVEIEEKLKKVIDNVCVITDDL